MLCCPCWLAQVEDAAQLSRSASHIYSQFTCTDAAAAARDAIVCRRDRK